LELRKWESDKPANLERFLLLQKYYSMTIKKLVALVELTAIPMDMYPDKVFEWYP